MITLLLQLFFTFFIIGLFNFGGGGAMISLIQTQIINVHGWVTESAFADICAISQTTPGPIGINCATYVGYEVMHNAGYSNAISVLGSATTTLAIVLPSFLIFMLLMKLFNHFHNDPKFLAIMKILKPAVAGLIGAAVIILMFRISWDGPHLQMSLIRENFPNWKSWLLFIAAFIATYNFKANPIYVIIAGGLAGFLLY